jgi:hypothetical protein
VKVLNFLNFRIPEIPYRGGRGRGHDALIHPIAANTSCDFQISWDFDTVMRQPTQKLTSPTPLQDNLVTSPVGTPNYLLARARKLTGCKAGGAPTAAPTPRISHGGAAWGGEKSVKRWVIILCYLNCTMQLAFTAGSAVCAAVVSQKDKILSLPIVSKHSDAVCAAASAVSGAVKDPKGTMIAAKNAVSSAVDAQKDKVLALPIVSKHSDAVCAAASAVSGAVKDPKGTMIAAKDSFFAIPISHSKGDWVSQSVSFSSQKYWLRPSDGSVSVQALSRSIGDVVSDAGSCVSSAASAVKIVVQNPKASVSSVKNAVSAAVVSQTERVLLMPVVTKNSEAACSAASAVINAINHPNAAVHAAKEAVSTAVVAQKDKVLALPIVSKHSDAVCAAASAVSGAVKDPKGTMIAAKNAVKHHVVAQKDKVLALPIVSKHSDAVCAAASAVSGAVKDPKGTMIAAKNAVKHHVVAQKDKVLALPIVSKHSDAVCAAASAVSGAVKDPKGTMSAIKQQVVVQRVVNDPFGSISEASRSSILFVSNVSANAYISTMQKLQARRQQLAADYPTAASHLAAAQHRVITMAAPVIQSIRSVVSPAPADSKLESTALDFAAKIDVSAVRAKVSSVVERANVVRSYYTAAAVSKGQNYASAVSSSAISVAQSIIRAIDSADVVVDGLLAMVAQKVIDDRELLVEYVLSFVSIASFVP